MVKNQCELMFALLGISYFGKLGNIQVPFPMLPVAPFSLTWYAKSSIGVKEKMSRAKRTYFTDTCPFVSMVVHHTNA